MGKAPLILGVINMRKSKTLMSDKQVDMRDIMALLPEVADIGTLDGGASSPWTHSGISELKEKLMIESIRGVLDKRCAKTTWQDTHAWLVDDSAHPFSFITICKDVLGIDPDRYRDAIFDLIRSRNPKHLNAMTH